MCGRYALFCQKNDLIDFFELKTSFTMASRFNVAPTQMMPVVTNQGLEFMRWGFVPHWHLKQEKPPSGYINARLEGILEKPSFKDAIKKNRCLIPASGYFEWKEVKGVKQPYFVHLENASLFAFAGVFSDWQDQNGLWHKTFAILTTEAVENLSVIHERMPLVIDSEFFNKWLHLKSKFFTEKILQLFFLKNKFIYYPVSRKVNNPSFDTKETVLHL